VTSIDNVWATLEAMAEHGLVLQVHGEVTDASVDVFDREREFIDRVLTRIVERVPQLRVVFEHVTTAAAVEFVRTARPGVAATITPQHLLMNRNAMFEGGMRPHHYCLPVLKRERDREALLAAATGDDRRFFLGTDSAPHARHTKEAACGCAGIFSAHAGLELYAEAFEAAGRLDRLEAFASERGADFYGLPRNAGHVLLERAEWRVPSSYPFGDDEIVPLRAGGTIGWRLVTE
jgi:dihydroorotase